MIPFLRGGEASYGAFSLTIFFCVVGSGFPFAFCAIAFSCGLLVCLCLVFAGSDGTGNRIGLDWFPD